MEERDGGASASLHVGDGEADSASRLACRKGWEQGVACFRGIQKEIAGDDVEDASEERQVRYLVSTAVSYHVILCTGTSMLLPCDVPGTRYV